MNQISTLGTVLTAPEPGWKINADVIVVGSGIAGLTAALELKKRVEKVVLVTKGKLSSGSTIWAQGGIAAALDPKDSPQAHYLDTLAAGGGLCDPRAVEVLVKEGPGRVRELIALGAKFDTDADGQVALTREGGHHADRIAHAGGDATGAEISRALLAQLALLKNDPSIQIIENAMVIDILTNHDVSAHSVTCGVTLHVRGEGTADGVGAVLAPAVVLATGGIGQVFLSSTNPAGASGDGIAAAVRAGAKVGDMEFVQFHPTVLWAGNVMRGQLTLISEAVRGEGAYLLDPEGNRFMLDKHPMAELAPRDVVAHAMVATMRKFGVDHLYLDARHLGAEFLAKRFPNINESLSKQGLNLSEDLIPVAPAQHYHSGGVITGLWGQTNIPGLYAVGEVACTGVHGANRLASNSLLEGLVFAHRAAEHIGEQFKLGKLRQLQPQRRGGNECLVSGAAQNQIRRIMTQDVGVVRSAKSLTEALETLNTIRSDQRICAVTDEGDVSKTNAPQILPQVAEWECSNLLQISVILAMGAKLREESRGGHFRSDFPKSVENFARRIILQLDSQGNIESEFSDVCNTK